MSFDANEFRNMFLGGGDADLNKVYGKRDRMFKFLKPKNLANGEHILRFLPAMPVKCPMNAVRVATHKVPTTIGNTITVECIQTGDEPCAICEVLVACKDVFRTLTPAVREALQTLSPWRRAIFPVAIYAQPKDSNDRQSEWVRTKDEHGAIFEVSAESLIRDIFNLFVATNGKLSNEQKGFYLKLHKNVNSYKLDLINKPCALQNMALIDEKNYPHITKLYLESEKFPLNRLTFDQQVLLLQQDCWWYAEKPVADACSRHFERMTKETDTEEDVLGELGLDLEIDSELPF